MFPGLEGGGFRYLNLEIEAAGWSREHPELFSGGSNPLPDPAVFQRMMDSIHRRRGVVWSYGGYLEDRSRACGSGFPETVTTFAATSRDRRRRRLGFAVVKQFRVTETKNLQFRAECFNLANHPNFQAPSTTTRQIQFALKLVF